MPYRVRHPNDSEVNFRDRVGVGVLGFDQLREAELTVLAEYVDDFGAVDASDGLTPEVVDVVGEADTERLEYVEAANKINMGTAPNPTIPMFVAQGANGILEGTPPGPPGVGRGDGVMIAGDVRTLMRKYCAAGLPIHYDEYENLSHIPGFITWVPGALQWLTARFTNQPAPNNCASVEPGNSLAPQRNQ